MNYPKELKYLAEMTCAADYFLSHNMDRTLETIGLNACLKQYLDFTCSINNMPENAKFIWKMLSTGREGTGYKEILAKSEQYNEQNALYHYNDMKTCILATEKLQEFYAFNGSDLFAISRDLNIYCWKLDHILNFREKMPRNLATALLSFEDITTASCSELKQAMYDNSKYIHAPKCQLEKLGG